MLFNPGRFVAEAKGPQDDPVCFREPATQSISELLLAGFAIDGLPKRPTPLDLEHPPAKLPTCVGRSCQTNRLPPKKRSAVAFEQDFNLIPEPHERFTHRYPDSGSAAADGVLVEARSPDS